MNTRFLRLAAAPLALSLLAAPVLLREARSQSASPAAPAPASSGRVLVQSDFSTLPKAISTINPDRRVEITGALPAGWDEDSGWQENAKIRYEPVTFTGRRGLSITPQSGTSQIKFPLAGFKGGARYRLRVVARNPRQLDIRVGIRDIGAPYSLRWSSVLGLGDEWSTQTLPFSLGAVDVPVALYLFISGSRGAAQISEVSLIERTPSDILADARRRFPGGSPSNLLRVTRMPLGMQSGWSVGNIERQYNLESYISLGDEAQAAPDPQVLGPSGAPALHLNLKPPRPGDLVPVYAEPFGVAQLDSPHTASVWVRGEGEGRLRVARTYWTTLSEAPFKVTRAEGWKRVEVMFAPGIEETVWNLELLGEGELWLDALQIEAGSKATPYRSQKPFEVSLARLAGDASIAGISFADEPMSFRWAVTGPQNQAARLRLKVIHADGSTRTLPPIAVAGSGFVRSGTASYNVLAGKYLGAFRVEAIVEDAQGQSISTLNELILTRVRRPKMWNRDAPDSPFGTHLNNTAQNIRLAKAIGFNWVRLHDASADLVKWNAIEAEQGKRTWNDEGVQRFRREKLSILGAIQGTPPWAARATGGTGYFDQYFLPRDYAQWNDFSRALLGRYQNEIPVWDVWNEPWGFGYLGEALDTSASARGQYVRPKDEKAEYKSLSDGVRAAASALPSTSRPRVTWDATRPLDWF